MPSYKKVFEISVLDENQSLKSFLLSRSLSSAEIKILMTTKHAIMINNRNANTRAWLKAGDVIELSFLYNEHSDISGVDKPLSIMFEDECVLVINKPKNLLSLSTNWENDSVAARVIAYYRANGIEQTVHILTRLDYETSGLMVIAKNGLIHSRMSRDNIKRIYHAEVDGVFPSGTIVAEFPIAKEEKSNTRKVCENGQYARTVFTKIDGFEQTSIVEAELFTGRTHQIRVHLAHLGYPIIGDQRYNFLCEKDDSIALKLECVKVKFKHPFKNEMVSLQL